MQLRQEQWQYLWNKTPDATEVNRMAVRDWLFELITEAGFDVQDDVVTRSTRP